jgi:hypothetical protein
MNIQSRFALARAALVAALCVLAGCAHWPPTPRLERAGTPGYRIDETARSGRSDDLLVILAFSGGGTRAAALGYGVLEELRRTEVTVNGAKRRLLDEVDVISAVSGGTFPAAYYALRGEKTFDEFEAKVLARSFETDLALRILTPTNWFRMPSGTFGKSDLFAELYDETVFDHATFADLKKAGGFRHHQRHRRHHRRAVQLHAGPVRRDLRRPHARAAGSRRRHLDGIAAAAHAHHLREPRWHLRPQAAGLGGQGRGVRGPVRDSGARVAPRPRAPVLCRPGAPVRPRLRRRPLRESRPGRGDPGF